MTETRATTHVWPCLSYRDAPGAIRFLTTAFGFREAAAYPGREPGVIEHAELHWPEGGGVMLGFAGRGGVHERPPGAALVYLVTADPDGVHARTLAAGGEIVQALREEDYGSRGFTARDPEGNLWSFGTYAGTG
jgi:uncharacterized glyoxalase superfamily protein PhnB